MSFLTNVLFWISTSLMIPVIVLLLISLIRSLIMLGGFYGLYMHRLKFRKKIAPLIKDGGADIIRPDADISGLKGNRNFHQQLLVMKEKSWSRVHSEKALADFEIGMEKELESARTLTRVGPMLGLMGTLIPMGPALVGLAASDIASMASNMQVAFSTTVIGIFIGAVGFITQLVKKRWGMEDVSNLEYLYEVASEKNPSVGIVSAEVAQ